MIDAARARGITTIVAGADATDHPAIYLDRGADVVVAGEGEVTLVELLDTLPAGADAERGLGASVDGLWLRGADGRIVRTPAARDHPRSRLAAAAGVGPRRRRSLSLDVARAARLLLDERGDDARLPVPLQLVREADLRPALHRAIAPSTSSRRWRG